MLIRYPAATKFQIYRYSNLRLYQPVDPNPKTLPKSNSPDSSFSVSSDWIAASELEMLKSGGGIERIGAGVNWLKEIDEAMLNQDL